MANSLASHAQALETAKSTGASSGTLRGQDALADLVLVTSSFESDGLVANDTIEITAPLPAGLVPVPALSYVAVETNPGTTLTLDIGTAEDPDAYADGINVATVGLVPFGVLPVSGLPESGKIIATVKSASGIGSGKLTVYTVCRAVS